MSGAHDLFWLAHYAHNTLAPLFAEAKAIDPSIRFSIEIHFGNPDLPHGEDRLDVYSHWDAKQIGKAPMFIYSTRHHAKADIDKLAVEVKSKIAHMHLDEAKKALEPVA